MSAIISECGQYRYRLEREVQPEGIVFAYFGINPSTADANLDDATVRKWRGFTLRNGGRKLIVGNVFAHRSTDVRKLPPLGAIGGENLYHIEKIISDSDILVPCWGSRAKVSQSLWWNIETMMEILTSSGKTVKTFGLTASGDPKHPLMLGYDTPLLPLTNKPIVAP